MPSSFLEIVLCDGALACPASRIHWKMPLSLQGLNIHQIGRMNHFHLDQTLEMDEWIYSRHRGLKGTDPADFPYIIATRLRKIGNIGKRATTGPEVI
jgi:hypothetical protein